MAAPSHVMHATASSHHILGAVSGADVSRRAAAAVLGALVGDAAALGFHWEYDQGKIAAAVAAGGGTVEFAAPGPPYHALRKTGDLSFYGETTLATLRSLRDAGHWSAAAFADAYFASFGPGGTYVGYADHTMKSIVGVLLRVKEEQGPLMRPIWGLADAAVRPRFYPPAWVALAKRVSPDDEVAFQAAAEAVAREANPSVAPETVAAVRGVAAALAPTYARRTGSDDTSSSVLAVLPPLAARYAGHRAFVPRTLDAIAALTSNADTRDLAAFLARALEAAILGAPLHDAVAANLRHLEQPLRGVIESAVKAADEFAAAHAAGVSDPAALVPGASHWGTSCDLVKGAPAAVFLLLAGGPAPDAAVALRANALVGGDSCARGVFLGAALGAARGVGGDAAGAVPSAWVARLSAGSEAAALASGLHEPVHGDASDHVEHVQRAAVH